MTDRDLILAAARLARTAPESWQQFLGAFSNYTEVQRENCISSPLEHLAVNQGRAQNCVALLRLLSDAVKLADQIERKNK